MAKSPLECHGGRLETPTAGLRACTRSALLLQSVVVALIFTMCKGQEWRGDQCTAGLSLEVTGSHIVVENCDLGSATLSVRLPERTSFSLVIRNTTAASLNFTTNAASSTGWLTPSDSILIDNSSFTSSVCFPAVVSTSDATVRFVGTNLGLINVCSGSSSVVSFSLWSRSSLSFVGCRFSAKVYLSLSASEASSALWQEVSCLAGLSFYSLQLSDGSSFVLNSSSIVVAAGVALPLNANASVVSIINTTFSGTNGDTAALVSIANGALTQDSLLTMANNTFIVRRYPGVRMSGYFSVSHSTLVVSNNAFPEALGQSSDVITIAPHFTNASVELNLSSDRPLYGAMTFDSGSKAGALRSVLLGPILNLQSSRLSLTIANLTTTNASGVPCVLVHDCKLDQLTVKILSGSSGPIDVDIQRVLPLRSGFPWMLDIASPVRSLLLAHSDTGGLAIWLQNLRSAAGGVATVAVMNVSGAVTFSYCDFQAGSLHIRDSRLDGLFLTHCTVRNSTIAIEANTVAVSYISVQYSAFWDSTVVVAHNYFLATQVNYLWLATTLNNTDLRVRNNSHQGIFGVAAGLQMSGGLFEFEPPQLNLPWAGTFVVSFLGGGPSKVVMPTVWAGFRGSALSITLPCRAYSRFQIGARGQFVRFQKARSLGGCSAVIFGKVRS
jgi:hypothetical protein